MLNLADVLQLVNDGLDERPLAEQEPVGELEELRAHILAQFGDEAQAPLDGSAADAANGPVEPEG